MVQQTASNFVELADIVIAQLDLQAAVSLGTHRVYHKPLKGMFAEGEAHGEGLR